MIKSLYDNEGAIENLQFCAGCLIDDVMYFSVLERNALCSYDLKSKKTNQILVFEGEDICKKRIHRKAFSKGDVVFFLPFYGSHIHLFNITTRTQKSIQVLPQGDEIVKFTNAFMIGEFIWLIPAFCTCRLLSINTNTYEIEEHDFFWKNFKEVCNNGINSIKTQGGGVINETFLDVTSCSCYKNKIIMSALGSNVVVEFDTDNKLFMKILSLGQRKCRSISCIGENVWVTFVGENDILRLNLRTKESKLISTSRKCEEEYPYINIIEYRNKLIILPSYQDNIYELENEEIELLETISLFVKEHRISKTNHTFIETLTEGNMVYFLPVGCESMIEFDMREGTFNSAVISIDSKYAAHALGTKSIRREGIDDVLSLFLKG